MILSGLVRIAGLTLGYILTVLLTRALGASGFGTIATGISTAAILATFSGFGLPTLATRDIARLGTSAEGITLQRISMLCVVAMIAVIATVVASLMYLIVGSLSLDTLAALAIFPVMALVQLRQGISIPLEGAFYALLPEQVLFPATAIVVCLMAHWQGSLGVAQAIAIYTASGIFAFLIGCARIAQKQTLASKPEWLNPTKTISEMRRLMRRSAPFLFSELPNTITVNIDVIVVAALLGADAAALYFVAVRLANLIVLPVSVVNINYMPLFAVQHGSTQLKYLQRSAREASFFSLTGGLAMALALYFSYPVLIGFFGPGFEQAETAFIILAAVRISTCAFAPNEAVLLMTGRESLVAFVAWVRAALLFTLTALGASQGSVITASIGTAVAILAAHALVAGLVLKFGDVFAYPGIERVRLRALFSGQI